MSSVLPSSGAPKHSLPAVSLRIVHPPAEKLDAQVVKLSEMASQVLSSLSSMKEDEIITSRKKAQGLGAQQLRIELACDAELWNRDQVKRGVNQGRSISASIAKRAKEIGCSPKTIKRNAKIFSLFKDDLDSTVQVLSDKGYYQVAVQAKDPHKTLQLFIEKKSTMPKFTVADATRFLAGEKKLCEGNRTKFIELNRSEENKALEAHINWAIGKIQKVLKPACPSAEFSKTIYNPFLLDLREYLDTMFAEDAKASLRSCWAAGSRTEDQMAKATGLSSAEVSEYMQMMADDGEFKRVEQRREVDKTKDGCAILWEKLSEPRRR